MKLTFIILTTIFFYTVKQELKLGVESFNLFPSHRVFKTYFYLRCRLNLEVESAARHLVTFRCLKLGIE